MYLHQILLENIRSHKHLSIKFPPSSYAGWHVIIGDNGAGKSTLVRSIALALAGPTEAAALRQDWREWLRGGADSGRIRLSIDSNPTFDKRTGTGRHVKKYYVPANLRLTREVDARLGRTNVKLSAARSGDINPRSYIWGTGAGWFSASYGPFRRFTGGNKDYEKLFYSNPKLAPHLTVFGEDVALTEALAWLQALRVRVLEELLAPRVLEDLARFVNDSGLLPHGTRLDKISATDVTFIDGAGHRLQVEQLSDGYRSILSLTFELIRQLVSAYGEEPVWRQLAKESITFNLPGVVLIDEVDAHLHPTWQRRIGRWFCTHFPDLQFIVTTHSPLVCQAAVQGSIWLLPSPNSQASIRQIKGPARDRLLYGNILEALDTELFGEDIGRSPEARVLHQRLAQLNIQSLRGQLSDEERDELEDLQRIFSSSMARGLEAS